jgi:ABC-type transport system involved in cytochrome bd biosynthesis fused ATPase/permease subunit
VLVSFLSRVVVEFLLHPVNLADIFFFLLLAAGYYWLLAAAGYYWLLAAAGYCWLLACFIVLVL